MNQPVKKKMTDIERLSAVQMLHDHLVGGGSGGLDTPITKPGKLSPRQFLERDVYSTPNEKTLRQHDYPGFAEGRSNEAWSTINTVGSLTPAWPLFAANQAGRSIDKGNYGEAATEAAMIAAPYGIGKGIGKIAPYVKNGVGKITNGVKAILPKGKSNSDIIASLKNELSQKGIISSQKTPNLPWKEPIRKGIEPWGYGDDAGIPITGSKLRDVKGAIFDGKNPLYQTEDEWRKAMEASQATKFRLSKDPVSEKYYDYGMIKRPEIVQERSLKKAISIRDKNRIDTENGVPQYFNAAANRYATWDMYLGKPQTKHPLYDISDLTTKNKTVYTIKEDFMNKPRITNKINGIINEIESPKISDAKVQIANKNPITKKGDSYIVPDQDKNYFGTMGGFHWDVKPMPDGNYKVMAKDVWDLQPFKDTNTGIKIIDKIGKSVKNVEVGKALGIGKPLDVQVGFIFDPKNRKIINTFGLTGAALLAKNKNQDMKKKITPTQYKAMGGTVKDSETKKSYNIALTKGTKEANYLDSLSQVYRGKQAIETEKLAKAYPNADIKGIVERAAKDPTFNNVNMEAKVDSIHKKLGFDPNIPGSQDHIETSREYENYTNAKKGVGFNQIGTKEGGKLEKTGLRTALIRIPRSQDQSPYKILDKDYAKKKCGGKVKHKALGGEIELTPEELAAQKLQGGVGKAAAVGSAISGLTSGLANENEMGGAGNAVASVGNVLGDTASMAATGASVAGPVGAIAGAGIGLVKGVVGLIGAGKRKREERDKKIRLQDKNETLAMGAQMAKGGKVKGAGTGTSDSISSKLDAGDFIVPAKNASKAMMIGKEHFGWKDNQTASLKDGDEPTKISNGEVRYTKDEADYLKEIGVNLNALAPEAKENVAYAAKGKLPSYKPKFSFDSSYNPDEPIVVKKQDKPILSEKDKQAITGVTDEQRKDQSGINALKSITDRSKLLKEDTTNPKKGSKAMDWLKRNPGTIAGLAQTAGGLLASGKNAREERSIQDIKSPAGAFSNEANKIKKSADQTVSAIMNKNNKDNADAMGNYMRVAKESGGSSSAAVLANAAKVSSGTSDNNVKGMLAAAQIKQQGQSDASRMVVEGAKATADTEQANRAFKEQRLARKSENANALIGAGAANIVGQSMNNNFQDRLADVETKYKDQLGGAKTGETITPMQTKYDPLKVPTPSAPILAPTKSNTPTTELLNTKKAYDTAKKPVVTPSTKTAPTIAKTVPTTVSSVPNYISKNNTPYVEKPFDYKKLMSSIMSFKKGGRVMKSKKAC